MNRMRNLLLLLLILILAPPETNASSSLPGKFRILEGLRPSKVETPEVSPSPNPLSSVSSDPSPLSSHHVAPMPADSPKVHLTDGIETCNMSSNQCRDQKSMFACLVHSPAQQELHLVVQNTGDSLLKVNVKGLLQNKEAEILEHQVKMIKFSTVPRECALIVLNAGNGNCVIHIGGAVSQGNVLDRFPYANRATPNNGTYLMFLTALVIGGVWACCKLRKRNKQHVDGVPYQELEMGQPESLLGDNVEIAEGWDQGWNDGWDEENEVKPPDENHVRNVSANGFTSRSSSREGCENDWDD